MTVVLQVGEMIPEMMTEMVLEEMIESGTIDGTSSNADRVKTQDGTAGIVRFVDKKVIGAEIVLSRKTSDHWLRGL